MLRRVLLVLAALAVLLPVAPAAAFRLGNDPLPPVRGNPADRFLRVAPVADAPAYDYARRCTHAAAQSSAIRAFRCIDTPCCSSPRSSHHTQNR